MYIMYIALYSVRNKVKDWSMFSRQVALTNKSPLASLTIYGIKIRVQGPRGPRTNIYVSPTEEERWRRGPHTNCYGPCRLLETLARLFRYFRKRSIVWLFLFRFPHPCSAVYWCFHLGILFCLFLLSPPLLCFRFPPFFGAMIWTQCFN